ncbi:MAG TPA: hypothetical protein ENK23_05360 [Sorangium sp.]|nr:hypothetical protein [Sorangium sp.]
MSTVRVVTVLLLLTACGPAPAAVTPAAEAITTARAPALSSGAPPRDVFAPNGPLEREALPATLAFPLKTIQLGAAAAAVDPVPQACSAYLSRKAVVTTCDHRAEALEALEAALAERQPASRDAALKGVERCASLPPGLVRALRAEAAPVACGDALTQTLVARPPAGIDGAVYDTLAGIAIGARLWRAVKTPPKAKRPYDKKHLKKYFSNAMMPWARAQATAIQQLATQGAQLRYYGRAIVALEAGMADLRFIDVVRTVPIPDTYRGDAGLTNAYYGSLEAALDPRKQRGRDATLVGLGQLASIGVIRDPRVDRARRALSRMYGGRAIDALDRLMLPPLSPSTATNSEQRLAARLPTFYAGLLFAGQAAKDPAFLRQLLEKGIAPQHRIALATADLPLSVRKLYGRARFELAQTYWRKVDIDEMLRLFGKIPVAQRDSDDKLFLALGLALQDGPSNAADMMVSAPLSELGIGNTAALDNIGSSQDTHAAMAAFDSALIAQLAAPATAPASYWRDVAKRYRKAAERLRDPLQRQDALKLAEDADQTAMHIKKRGQ